MSLSVVGVANFSDSGRKATSVWITRHGELWFGGTDHDRMDVLPEKKSYQPGETARLPPRGGVDLSTNLCAIRGARGLEKSGVVCARWCAARTLWPTART